MRYPTFIIVLALAAGCAPTRPLEEPSAEAARREKAGATYTTCVTREAERNMKNPAGAEDIAVAAHGRCWSAWEAYREATRESFLSGARTPEERQLAQDKMEAHLRDFERDTRRGVIDTVVQRSLAPASR